MISFFDFIQTYSLKIKATSRIKIRHILSSLALNDVKIFLRDGSYTTDVGIVNLQLTKGMHCIA